MRLTEPLEPEPGSDLLVGAGGEDEVSAGLESLLRERRDRHRARDHLALHVEGATAPDLTFSDLPRPGVKSPLRRVREDGVGVRQEDEPRAAALPGYPRNEVRALGNLRVQLRRHAVVAEVLAQELGRAGLVPRWVDRVDADQLLEEGRHLLPQRDGRHYVRVPSVSR